MKEQEFKEWLDAYRSRHGDKLAESTKHTYVTDNKRVVNEDGVDLDKEFDKDKLYSLLERYAYGKDDERHNRPNPTKLDIDAPSIYGSLSSHRTALRHYRRFRLGIMTP